MTPQATQIMDLNIVLFIRLDCTMVQIIAIGSGSVNGGKTICLKGTIEQIFQAFAGIAARGLLLEAIICYM